MSKFNFIINGTERDTEFFAKVEEFEKESWIKNVMRVLKFSKEEAEAYYVKIKVFSDSKPKNPIDELLNKLDNND
jgi:hypothetical protein